MADNYTVGVQSQTTTINGAGQTVKVIRINFTVPNGVNYYVDVPVASYNATTAKAAIENFLASLDAVANL